MVAVKTQPFLLCRWTYLLLFMVLTQLGCAEKGSDEAQIKAQIEKGIAAIESKDSGDALSVVGDDFSGNQNRSKKDLRRLMLGYFLRYKDVGVTTLGTQVDVQSPVYAEANFTVLLTGGEHLIPENARQYQVSSCWRKIDDEWLMTCLKWE